MGNKEGHSGEPAKAKNKHPVGSRPLRQMPEAWLVALQACTLGTELLLLLL